MNNKFLTMLILAFVTLPITINAQKKEATDLNSSDISVLKFRELGPALMSGRIADLAVNPNDHSEFYIAVASGGVWKTQNSGISFTPIFDSQSSYSIGCVTIDPNNSNVVWVGSGENNNQRSVAYGDGVYKSLDGGKSWSNMGLKSSEHIGMIKVDPRNSDIVYVAAYGPLWSEGGDRGLYKTTNGGKNWTKVLDISKYTGVSEVHLDPSNPDVLYATAHQRMRHVFTYLGGGPESAIFKSTDAGKTWNKIMRGMPSGDVGRIGMGVSPVDSNVLYAVVEAKNGSGTYKSTNAGASWSKMNSYSTSGNYYQELFCDPIDVDKVYFMDTYMHRTVDGGKTINRHGERNKHVDNHVIWINPSNTKHLRLGTDGGLYESFDEGNTWRYFANLPLTQFYKVAVDDDKPFYNIYGGTQDNNSIGGPSRTTSSNGIENADWFITNGGDGFESAVEPGNPNIVYAQSQYGYLVRFDKNTGEKVGIKPMPMEGEKAFRWNWDSPLIISPHNPTRLYFAANKLFKSDDRGNTWERVSPDLTRQLDRNKLPVMGRVWEIDAVMKNMSTTIYGNIVALDESPLVENLIYVGTDDGLIQVSEDAKTWKKYEKFPGVPEMTYVNSVFASQHNANTVYASFNNHKKGDFKPYILKSTNKGKSWKSISSNLPERGSVYDVVEDHINPNILFAGTEFGVFVSINAGASWTQIKNGLPTIAVRDIEIQKEHNDLVLATFGRGFYVLEDYSLIREIAENGKAQQSKIYPVKQGLIFGTKNPYGGRGKASQGESFYATQNPEQGVNFRFYLSEEFKSVKQKRNDLEKEQSKDGKSNYYPNYNEIRQEAWEEKPQVLISIFDMDNNEIRRIVQPYKKGLQQYTWNGRITSLKVADGKSDRGMGNGPWVVPGEYQVSISWMHNGEVKELISKTKFSIESLYNQSIKADREDIYQFQKEANSLYAVLRKTNEVYSSLKQRVSEVEQSLKNSPNADLSHLKTTFEVKQKLNDLGVSLNGDAEIAKYQYEVLPSLNERVGTIVWNQFYANVNITKTNKDNLELVKKELGPIKEELDTLNQSLKQVEEYLKSGEFMPLK
jgi:photosystem II stability/assembly factor-like uncharacterized protein